jgi:aminomethyltransferase
MQGPTPPPRSHYGVWKDGVQIGETCSGGLSPTLSAGIGMAYLPPDAAKPGTAIDIDIRGRRFPAIVEKKPLRKTKV